MASPVNPLTGSTGTNTTGSSTAGTSASSADNQQVFLQLLVSQLQNQDPLNPTDSTQFVSELAQFSELEQVIGIRTDIESYHAQTTTTTDQTPTNTQTAATDAAPKTGQTQS